MKQQPVGILVPQCVYGKLRCEIKIRLIYIGTDILTRLRGIAGSEFAV